MSMAHETPDLLGEIVQQIDEKFKNYDSPAFTTPAKNRQAPESPVTPQTAQAVPKPVTDYAEFLRSTIMWDNKVRSSVYFLGGVVLLFTLRWWMSQNVSVVSGICYVLLLSLTLNFVRGTVFPRYQDSCTWSSSAWTSAVTNASATVIKTVAALHDRYMQGQNPNTFKVAMTLWIISLLGKVLSPITCAFYAHVFLFTLPVIYSKYQAQVDKAVNDAINSAKHVFDGLDRRAKMGISLGPVMLLAFFFSYFDVFAMTLIAAVYVKSLLKPNEIESISRRIQPVFNAATKAALSSTHKMGEVATRYDLTPTPVKKKNQ